MAESATQREGTLEGGGVWRPRMLGDGTVVNTRTVVGDPKGNPFIHV